MSEEKSIVGSIVFAPPSGNIANPPDLQAALARARLHRMTPKEAYEQKVSWLMGMSGKLTDPMPSREQIVKALEAMGIIDPDSCSPASTRNDNAPSGDEERQ